jgi:hypothetical protein
MSAAVFTQNTKRIHLNILSSMISLGLLQFSTLYHKRYDFRQKAIEQKNVCFIISSTLYETFLVLRGTQLDTIINLHKPAFKILVGFFRL